MAHRPEGPTWNTWKTKDDWHPDLVVYRGQAQKRLDLNHDFLFQIADYLTSQRQEQLTRAVVEEQWQIQAAKGDRKVEVVVKGMRALKADMALRLDHEKAGPLKPYWFGHSSSLSLDRWIAVAIGWLSSDDQ